MSNPRAALTLAVPIAGEILNVKAYPLTREAKISRSLRTPDGNPVAQVLVDKVSGEVVNKDDCTGAYDVDGKPVTTDKTEADFSDLKPGKAKVLGCAPIVFTDLVPTGKHYSLTVDDIPLGSRLAAVLTEERAGLVIEYVHRGTPHLALLGPGRTGLSLSDVAYADESAPQPPLWAEAVNDADDVRQAYLDLRIVSNPPECAQREAFRKHLLSLVPDDDVTEEE